MRKQTRLVRAFLEEPRMKLNDNYELIDLLLSFRRWDKSIDEINDLIPILTCSDLTKVKEEIEARLTLFV